MTKKLAGSALARFEAGRDIWQEVLDGVREIKAGRGRRISVEPGSPIVRARLKSGLTQAQFAALLGGVKAHPGAMGAGTARSERSGRRR